MKRHFLIQLFTFLSVNCFLGVMVVIFFIVLLYTDGRFECFLLLFVVPHRTVSLTPFIVISVFLIIAILCCSGRSEGSDCGDDGGDIGDSRSDGANTTSTGPWVAEGGSWSGKEKDLVVSVVGRCNWSRLVGLGPVSGLGSCGELNILFYIRHCSRHRPASRAV